MLFETGNFKIFVYIIWSFFFCFILLQPKDKVLSFPPTPWSRHCLCDWSPAQYAWINSLPSCHCNDLRWPNCILNSFLYFWSLMITDSVKAFKLVGLKAEQYSLTWCWISADKHNTKEAECLLNTASIPVSSISSSYSVCLRPFGRSIPQQAKRLCL